MNKNFVHYLKIVAAVHIGVILLLVLISIGRVFFLSKPDVMLPVDFVVEVPSAPVVTEKPARVVHEKEAQDMPSPTPEHEPERKRKIERSKIRIIRGSKERPARKQLSEKEIKKLLAQGAKAGDHTSIPDDDARCFEIVRQALYGAWVQPSAEEAAGAVAEASIRLRRDGIVVDRNLVRKSGNPVLDASVMQALHSIRRIAGLSSAFVNRHEVITVSFEIE